MQRLASLVRGARALKGWSVNELGERSGISANTLRAWESREAKAIEAGKSNDLVQANAEKLLAFLASEGVEMSSDGERLTVSVPVEAAA